MKELERPAPILVAARNQGFDGVADAAVGFDSCIPQIIESAQDVVAPKRREREAEQDRRKPGFWLPRLENLYEILNGSYYTPKLLPQLQLRFALGLCHTNELSIRDSVKSSVSPSSSG